MEETKFFSEEVLHEKRLEIDKLFRFMREEQELGNKGISNKDDELYMMGAYQAVIALKSAKMWLGVMLEGRGSELPKQFADKAE